MKKYASLKGELSALLYELSEKPDTGTPLGNNVYKIRLGIASKGRGKRSGARVITCFRTVQGSVYLLSIYDKGERDRISDHEIQQILSDAI